MAPAEDFASSAARERETFSMVNIEPRLPGLNRQIWEPSEEIVRAEACRHGRIDVFTGPIFPSTKRIGKSELPVPIGFFKIAVDPSSGWALAFLMSRKAGVKADAPNKTEAISTIVKVTGITFPLPAGADLEAQTSIEDRVLKIIAQGNTSASLRKLGSLADEGTKRPIRDRPLGTMVRLASGTPG
jgi:DNA/RNA endonuclease G (NUC1)